MKAELGEANLTGARLVEAYLDRADLVHADLSGASLNRTVFARVDLSTVNGLTQVVHPRPSTIGIDTIELSRGQIPEAFLRGAGVAESFITNMKALVASMGPIQFFSCFISYSHNCGFRRRK